MAIGFSGCALWAPSQNGLQLPTSASNSRSLGYSAQQVRSFRVAFVVSIVLLRPQILSLDVSPFTGGTGQYDLVLLAGQDETGRQPLPIGPAGVFQGEPPLAGKCRRLTTAEFRSLIGHCGSSSGYCDCAAVGLALYCHRSSSPRLQRATAPSRCTDVVLSNVLTFHATQWTAYSRLVWNKR